MAYLKPPVAEGRGAMAAIGSGKESRSRSRDTANVPANPTRMMDPRPNRPQVIRSCMLRRSQRG
jgi:hypothetical protein